MASLVQFLGSQDVREKIAPYINGGPQWYPEVVREVLRIEARRPLMASCARQSVVDAIRLAASWPLKIGSDDGSALIVKRRGATLELVAMQTAKAKISLLRRSKAIIWHNIRCVFAKETYQPFQGSDPRVEHGVIPDPQLRGELIGGYAEAIQSKDLPRVVVTMHRSEIDEIRREFSEEWADGALDDLLWYVRKTLAHRLGDELALDDSARRDLNENPDVGVLVKWDTAPVMQAEPGDPYGLDAKPTVSVPVHNPREVVDAAAVKDAAWPADPRAPKAAA